MDALLSNLTSPCIIFNRFLLSYTVVTCRVVGKKLVDGKHNSWHFSPFTAPLTSAQTPNANGNRLSRDTASGMRTHICIESVVRCPSSASACQAMRTAIPFVSHAQANTVYLTLVRSQHWRRPINPRSLSVSTKPSRMTS